MRSKLKHVVTAPTLPSATSQLPPATALDPPACQHCHRIDTRFYCDSCLTSRIEAHHTEMRRLSLTRDKAKACVNHLLFPHPNTEAVRATFSSSSQPSPSTGPMQTINENALPDPFESNAAEQSSTTSSDAKPDLLDLYSLIQLRARRSAIIERVQTVHRCISESQLAHLQGQEVLKEKVAHIALRKQNLAKAWSALEGSSAAAPASAAQRSRIAAKSRWLTHPAADHIDLPLVYTDVYTHYERQSDDHSDAALVPTSQSTDHQLGAILTRARLDLAALKTEAHAVSTQLAVTRAYLARQAFSIFTVSPPDTPSFKPPLLLRTRQLDLSASGSVAQRISRLSEKYIPGAFGLQSSSSSSALTIRTPQRDTVSDARQSKPSSASASASASSSNWSIASLPLPLPSEARRYPREAVNGAVTYAANLLQLVAAYLGIALPFSIEQHKGRLAICPDPLWDGGGGSSAKTLHLSSSAYTYLTATHTAASRPSKLNNLAESTYGLGASTLSTIESYIHLPSSTSLPWGLSSTSAQPSKPTYNTTPTHAEADQNRRSDTNPRTGFKSKPEQAAKSFVSALVMFSYNVAYLAAKQGIRLDLVAAAANPLEILTKVMQQAELGRFAHANHIRPSSIQDLRLPGLDYEQLAQILEPNNATADSYKRGSTKSAKVEMEKASSSKPSKTPKILEQSYVDVGEAAASVFDIKDPSTMTRKPNLQSPSSNRTPSQQTPRHSDSTLTRQAGQPNAISSLQKQRVDAGKRSSSAMPAQPPPSLDFLRQRGRDASKAKPDYSNASPVVHLTGAEPVPAKVGPGAVIFNGVEVGVGNLTPTDSTRGESGKKPRKQTNDEGWNLV